ncbi:MAG: TetR/AcrR family transcriptional regulator [Spirochaetales bacterium]
MSQTRTARMIYQIPETRRMILDTAWKLFLERGFFDTQMKDVADAAGIGRTSLYRYFQDKTDLAATLMDQALSEFSQDEEWRDELPAGANGLETLRSYFRSHWLSPRFHEQFVFLAEFDAFFSGNRIPGGKQGSAGFRATLNEHLQSVSDFSLADLFAQGIIDGSIRGDLDLHLTGVTLLNAVRSLQQRVLLRGDLLIETLPGEPEKMTFALVDLLIDGLRPTQGDTP